MAEQRDQEDVLPKKDHVTKSRIGLQQWGDSPMGDAVGTGGSGTAERAARISRGQKEQAEEQAGAHEE